MERRRTFGREIGEPCTADKALARGPEPIPIAKAPRNARREGAVINPLPVTDFAIAAQEVMTERISASGERQVTATQTRFVAITRISRDTRDTFYGHRLARRHI